MWESAACLNHALDHVVLLIDYDVYTEYPCIGSAGQNIIGAQIILFPDPTYMAGRSVSIMIIVPDHACVLNAPCKTAASKRY